MPDVLVRPAAVIIAPASGVFENILEGLSDKPEPNDGQYINIIPYARAFRRAVITAFEKGQLNLIGGEPIDTVRDIDTMLGTAIMPYISATALFHLTKKDMYVDLMASMPIISDHETKVVLDGNTSLLRDRIEIDLENTPRKNKKDILRLGYVNFSEFKPQSRLPILNQILDARLFNRRASQPMFGI
ncbi:MAG TPA: hypothetical protein DIS76_00455 [Rhodospirillaceae bacterium]|nr:hypothetical protein [Rhodospirillaceae bacterium]